jgi:hypothetical protein
MCSRPTSPIPCRWATPQAERQPDGQQSDRRLERGGIFTVQSGTPFSILSGRATLNRSSRSTNNTADTSLTLSQLKDLFQTPHDWATDRTTSPLQPSGRTDARSLRTEPRHSPARSSPNRAPAPSEPCRRRCSTRRRVWDSISRSPRKSRSRRARASRFVWTAPTFFNHTTWYVGDQTLTSTTFGKITSQFYGNRLIQFGLNLKF